MIDKYKDIINIKHFEFKHHKRLSNYIRSAQFAPFAALNGYEELINNENIITDNKKELTNEEKININNLLLYLKSKTNDNIIVKLIYFIKDKNKIGGSNINYIGYIKKIDFDNFNIILSNNIKINIDDILYLNIEK